MPNWPEGGQAVAAELKQAHVNKNQLISKCLFGVFNISEKMNKNMLHNSKNEFICSFLEE